MANHSEYVFFNSTATRHFRVVSGWHSALALAIALVACDGNEAASTGDAQEASDSAAEAPETGSEASETAGEAATDEEAEASDASGQAEAGSESGEEADSDEDSADAEDASEGQDAGELGDRCETNADCQSEKCKMVRGMMGMSRGVCSECLDAEECRSSGEGTNCSYDRELGYATCSEGNAGEACEETDDCRDGLHCAEVLGGRGLCSACADSSHCEDDSTPICALTGTFGMGQMLALECVAEASSENDQLCLPGEDGDAACAGYCVPVETMQNSELGVCGACRPDQPEDCGDEQTCVPPMLGMGGITGSVCEG